MPELRSLTDRGLDEAYDAIARVRSGESAGIDTEEFSEPELSTPSGWPLPPLATFAVETRWQLAIELFRALEKRTEGVSPREWSWLAIQLFDVLCPVVNGRRKVREDARYILLPQDFRKAHRHLLAGPFLLYLAHNDSPGSVRGLLATRPESPGEVYEQLASRKFLVTSGAVVTVATRLYLDDGGALKRGAGGDGAGTPRRLGDVLQQFDKTYDLQAMSPETLLTLLPKEFGRFIKRA
jgi:hypothetical protein